MFYCLLPLGIRHVLYVLVFNTPVLASNNEFPCELSYQCSFLISCFRPLYMGKADFPHILSSHIYLSASFTSFFTEVVCSSLAHDCWYSNFSFRVRFVHFVFRLFMYRRRPFSPIVYAPLCLAFVRTSTY
uniref:Putative secreted protein n=1 Tax=Ixodes ricinus TaxID=34613 RepID=A0A147BIX1_IXORI